MQGPSPYFAGCPLHPDLYSPGRDLFVKWDTWPRTGNQRTGRKGISCLFLRKSNRLFHSQSEKAIILILDFCHVCISYSVEGECSRLLSTLPVGYSLTHRNRRLFRSDSSTCAFVQGQIPSSRKVEDGLPGGRLTHKIKRSAYAFYPCQALLESESHLRYLHH